MLNGLIGPHQNGIGNKMNKEAKIKALAELDGLITKELLDTIKGCGKGHTFESMCDWREGKLRFMGNYYTQTWGLKPYLTSYDAIIPLLRKQWEANAFTAEKFYQAIPNYYPNILTFMQYTTPSELADALLRATGKWKE